MWHKKFDASEVPEYIEGNTYSNKDLELMAELLLREDARREQCRSCNQFGTETGEFRVKDMVDKEGNPVVDEEGVQLKIKYPEYICPDQHKWFKGEGKAKGTKGENPILFEEHIIQRKRREIACVDAETQCLSKINGWVSYDTLQIGDYILAYDQKTFTTRWEPILDITDNLNISGEIYRLYGKGFDTFTTANHTWPVEYIWANKNIKGDIIRGRRSDKITSEAIAQNPSGYKGYLPLSAPHEAPSYTVLPDEIVRLVAWTLTEGHIWGRKTGSRIAITQSHIANQPFYEEICRDINSLGANWDTFQQGTNLISSAQGYQRREGLYARLNILSGNGGTIEGREIRGNRASQIILSGTEVDNILVHMTREKIPTMTFFNQLTNTQIKEFCRILMQAEGTKGTNTFNQYDQDRIDAACIAFTLGAYPFSQIKCGGTARQKKNKAPKKWVHRIKSEIVPYSGIIWCPTLPSGNWVARRKGKVFITGNSSTGDIDPSIVRGIYWRAYPLGGRQINSKEDRAKRGLGYYR